MMNFYIYLITPFIAWFCAGILKFLINSVKAKQLGFKQIGYGGMPSNHSTIVSSMAALIAFKQGIDNPAFGVGITLAFIVVMDANALRKTIEKHAITINRININDSMTPLLKERIGHSKTEIFAGICLGICIGYIMHLI